MNVGVNANLTTCQQCIFIFTHARKFVAWHIFIGLQNSDNTSRTKHKRALFTREKQLSLDLETSFAIHAVIKYKRNSECVLQVPKALVPIRLDRLHVKETKIM